MILHLSKYQFLDFLLNAISQKQKRIIVWFSKHESFNGMFYAIVNVILIVKCIYTCRYKWSLLWYTHVSITIAEDSVARAILKWIEIIFYNIERKNDWLAIILILKWCCGKGIGYTIYSALKQKHRLRYVIVGSKNTNYDTFAT